MSPYPRGRAPFSLFLLILFLTRQKLRPTDTPTCTQQTILELTHSLSLLWWDLLFSLIYLRLHFVLVFHSFPLLGKQVLAMSHVRRRPDLWSYISFSRPASRSESPTLPLNRADEFDPFEKAGRRYPSPFVADAEGHYNDSKPAWRSPGSRSRIIKIGAAITLILLIAYVLIPGEKARTEKTITGMYCLLACLP